MSANFCWLLISSRLYNRSVLVPSSAELNLNYIPSPRHIYTSFPPLDSPAPSRHHPVLLLSPPDLILPLPDLFNLCPALIHPHPVLIRPCPVLTPARPVLFILLSVPILPHPVLVLPRGDIIPLHLVHVHPRDPLRLVPIHPALLALNLKTVIVNLSIRLFHLIHSANSFPPLPRSTPSHDVTSSVPNSISSSTRKTLLVLGDSNTKYIRFPNTGHHRIPTYSIEEIDPSVCIGYAKIWIHVGINNLKSVRCGAPDDVQKSFELFTHKIERIGRLSPDTTVIISPILPTGVDILNERAGIFNELLFSTKRWWLELDFSIFANKFGMLDKFFRCFGNPKDKIHLGANGIRELEHMIASRISLVDVRSYSAVVQSNST